MNDDAATLIYKKVKTPYWKAWYSC